MKISWKFREIKRNLRKFYRIFIFKGEKKFWKKWKN